MSKNPLFNMPLSAEHRAALERVRAKIGARSAADAIRKLIEENDPERVPVLLGHPVTGWGDALGSDHRPPAKPLASADLKRLGRAHEDAVVGGRGFNQPPAKPLSTMSGKPNPKGGKK